MFDGLGRPIQVKSNGHKDNYCKVTDTEYTLDFLNGMPDVMTVVTNYVPYADTNTGSDLISRPSSVLSSSISKSITNDGLFTLIHNTDATYRFSIDKGEVLELKEEGGSVTRTLSDGLGRIVKTIDDSLTETEYLYKSGTGALLKIEAAKTINGTPSVPIETDFKYNLLGQKEEVIDPDMGNIKYTYYDNGNLETITDANGNVTTYTYDQIDRMIESITVLPDGRQYGMSNRYDSNSIPGWDAGYCNGRLVASFTLGTGGSKKFFKYNREGRIVKEKHEMVINT